LLLQKRGGGGGDWRGVWATSSTRRRSGVGGLRRCPRQGRLVPASSAFTTLPTRFRRRLERRVRGGRPLERATAETEAAGPKARRSGPFYLLTVMAERTSPPSGCRGCQSVA